MVEDDLRENPFCDEILIVLLCILNHPLKSEPLVRGIQRVIPLQISAEISTNRYFY